MESVLTSCLSLALTSMYCRAMLKAVVGDTISANWGRAMQATAHKMDRRLFQRREEDVVNIISLSVFRAKLWLNNLLLQEPCWHKPTKLLLNRLVKG